MYDYDNDEDTAGYDYKEDGGESEARHGINMRELLPEPKSNSRDFADGLLEWVESKAGRPIPESCDENNENVDAKKLFEELRAEADKELDEELNNPEYWEKVKQDANEISSRTPMYDFGLGQMSNELAMLDFYGLEIVQRIWHEISEANNLPNSVREVGQISTKLWQELKDIRAGRIPNPKSTSKKKKAGKHTVDPSNSGEKKSESSTKPKKKESKKVEIVQRERQKGDDYFMITERGVIRNKSYRELFKGRGIVYEWLWANLVRDTWIDTKGYPIKEKYYDRGLFAYCSTPGKIGRDCGGMSKNTVEKYIKEFEEAGIIKIDYLVREGNEQGQRVYILGEWKKVNGEIIERYYRDEVFLSEKPVKN